MFLNTLSFIFYTWTITLILQLLGVIWILPRKSNQFIDKGWALGRIISWLSIALAIWFLASLKIPLNTTLGLWLVFFVFTGLSIHQLVKFKKQIKKSISSIKPYIIVEEILFALGLTFLTFTRAFNPNIQDLEKPMDAGFMASYLRTPTLPAPDMWLSGESINYYSFGHFLGSIMSRLWHLEVSFSYNLLLALIMGLSLSLSFSIAANLIHLTAPKGKFTLKIILGGLLSSILVSVGGNTHTIWYLAANKSWQSYWYADATRFIHNTIHEFPSYSFVVADIHAHVWNFPLVLSFILVVIYWVLSLFKPLPKIKAIEVKFLNSFVSSSHAFLFKYHRFLVPSVFIGIFLGVFAMTSAWDAMIYSLLLAILGLIVIIYDYKKLFPLLMSAVTAIVVAGLIALPWLVSFTSISEGIALVTEGSPLSQFLALWSGHILLSLLAVIFAFIIIFKAKHKSQKVTALVILGLVFTAWILLLLPELIYFKDIYSGHPRANTMFKFTYQAFILMGLSGGWLMGAVLTNKLTHYALRAAVVSVLLIITAAFITFPYFSYKGYYGDYKNFQGIHGYQWLKERYPTDYAAIHWMQKNISGQPVIVEAVGESYTDYARVSAYTGLPAVLGWRVHEWLWRGGFDIPGQRTEEVRAIYERPHSPETSRYLEEYQVEYIFVGDKEYETYESLDINKLTQLGEIIYTNGRTLIIRRTSS